MVQLGIKFVEQYRIRRTGRNIGRSYYLDFAIPDKMLAIECDGKAWHTGIFAAYHKRRQIEIEKMGWTFVRFTGSEICTNPESCARTILSHTGGKS